MDNYYKITLEDGSFFWMKFNGEQANFQVEDSWYHDPENERYWNITGYQVADSQHCEWKMAEMLSETESSVVSVELW